MRLSDADREELFGRLSRHAAAGRLSIEELERRVAEAARAQTHEEAAALVADLPPLAAEPGTGSGRVPAATRAWGRARAHGEADRPAVDWSATNERFRDPKSHRIMRVWVDAAGGRHYVPDDAT